MKVTAALILLLLIAPFAAAQRMRPKPVGPPKDPATKEKQNEIAEAAAQSRAKLMATTKEYQASLEKLLALFAGEEERARALLEKRRALFDQGVISKRELEESERLLAQARSKIEETRQSINEADQLITEVIAAEQLAKLPAGEPPDTISRPHLILIRYTGTNRWALTDAAKVDAFFRGTFGRPLPVSAFGQTATHNHLGFDHRESLDVALHPDSAEGRAVMDYLRAQGIPFMAFRGALAGSATGAHIHIGRPSQRITSPAH
jgi:hypothetical protein